MSYPEIERRDNLSSVEFFKDYVGKKPVIITGLIKNWEAMDKWKDDYFLNLAGDTKIKVKVGVINERVHKEIYLKDYIRSLMGKVMNQPLEKKQEYLHDVPLPTLLPSLKNDMNPFPANYLGKWYRYKWWRNLFFFYGAAGNLTPMHFDNLGTHNLFFHIRGKKKFIMIGSEDVKYCYMHKYSWSRVDPENPDFDKYPLFKNARPHEGMIFPGDVLYMPPYTLHHVRSIDSCVSMNVDWHTKKSVVQWILKLHKGMRLSRVYYNMLYFAGIVLKIPPRVLYPLYKFYLRNG